MAQAAVSAVAAQAGAILRREHINHGLSNIALSRPRLMLSVVQKSR